jgi:prefoldin subunit 5
MDILNHKKLKELQKIIDELTKKLEEKDKIINKLTRQYIEIQSRGDYDA